VAGPLQSLRKSGDMTFATFQRLLGGADRVASHSSAMCIITYDLQPWITLGNEASFSLGVPPDKDPLELLECAR